jgi:hypothetical protein
MMQPPLEVVVRAGPECLVHVCPERFPSNSRSQEKA